jgi:hypothetical protein
MRLKDIVSGACSTFVLILCVAALWIALCLVLGR